MAPFLYIYPAHHDRVIATKQDESVVKVCQFVDDFLILVDCAEQNFLEIGHGIVASATAAVDFPVNNSLRFLDFLLLITTTL